MGAERAEKLPYDCSAIKRTPTLGLSTLECSEPAQRTTSTRPPERRSKRRPSLVAKPGCRRAYWAVKVSANWRVVFRFDGRDVRDVDLTDYH